MPQSAKPPRPTSKFLAMQVLHGALTISDISLLTSVHMRRMVLYIFMGVRAVTRSITKIDRLRQTGTLNAQPVRVQATWFQPGGFFDAHDLVQVKYEMLRHSRQDGVTKAEAASLFGLSRPTFYQAQAAFERDGIAGLLPQPRGPKTAHKLTPQVMQIVESHHRGGGPLQAREMARLVHAQLGIEVHPRSIERAVARKKKR